MQEMIADLKADSARWEAETTRRAERGYPRGNYYDDKVSQGPNRVPANYNTSSIHESRQQTSYPPPTSQPYMDSYPSTQNPYPPQPNPSGYPPSYNPPPTGYPSEGGPYGSVPSPYGQAQSSAPAATTAEMQSSYIYTQSNTYPYADGRSAPRYAGQGYENDGPDYPPAATTGIGYAPTTAPDPRMMDPRYSPEAAYPGGPVRSIPPTQRDAPRRPR